MSILLSFSRYQALSAALGWLGDGDCYLMHKMLPARLMAWIFRYLFFWYRPVGKRGGGSLELPFWFERILYTAQLYILPLVSGPLMRANKRFTDACVITCVNRSLFLALESCSCPSGDSPPTMKRQLNRLESNYLSENAWKSIDILWHLWWLLLWQRLSYIKVWCSSD